MATLTIRDLDDELRAKLRLRAAGHGRSMEAEVRAILREALTTSARAEPIGTRITQRFAAIGGEDLALPERSDPPRAAELPS